VTRVDKQFFDWKHGSCQGSISSAQQPELAVHHPLRARFRPTPDTLLSKPPSTAVSEECIRNKPWNPYLLKNQSINEPLSTIADTKRFGKASDLLPRAAGSAPAAAGCGAQPGSRSEVGCTRAGWQEGPAPAATSRQRSAGCFGSPNRRWTPGHCQTCCRLKEQHFLLKAQQLQMSK